MNVHLLVDGENTLRCPICEMAMQIEPMKYLLTTKATHPKGEGHCPWSGFIFRADPKSGLAERLKT